MKKLGHTFFCRNCKKLVDVCECYREEKVFPDLRPEFDVITWCCSLCNEPIIEVSELQP
ncbi:MAG: hypothetical protein SVM80_08355 [Halobacteriota archaeon]|nr:hypothetical protein [Halobacteriota archaeon]